MALPTLSLKEIESLCRTGSTFQRAQELVARNAFVATARTEESLYAQVQGDSGVWVVRIRWENGELAVSCSCPASRYTRYCHHAIATLIAWNQTPERFTLLEASPAVAPSKGRTKRETVERKDLQIHSIQQTLKLVSQMAQDGKLSVSEAQIQQLYQVAQNLEQFKTRRLAQSVRQIADLLSSEQSRDEARYAELLMQLWLTARALELHFESLRPLPEQQAEEMLGRTWREKDLTVREQVRLAELMYENTLTPNGFRLDISHLVDLDTGELYREMKIVPTHIPQVAREYKPARPLPFHAPRIGIYPGYPTKRVKILEEGEPLNPMPNLYELLRPVALSTAQSLHRQYRELVADPFAPSKLAVVVSVEQFVAWQGRVWYADTVGELVPLWVRLSSIPPEYALDSALESERAYPNASVLHQLQSPLLFGYAIMREGQLGLLPLSAIGEQGILPLRTGVHSEL